jgi:hypothetical protein
LDHSSGAAHHDYWTKKRTEAFEKICHDEGLDPDAFNELFETYQFSNKEPLSDDVMTVVKTPPQHPPTQKRCAEDRRKTGELFGNLQ